MSDLTEFEKYCKDNLVQPLAITKHRVADKNNKNKRPKLDFNVHEDSVLLKTLVNQDLSNVNYYDIDSPIEFCNNGQNAVMRNMSGSKILFDMVLDFHGYTANEAIKILEKIINHNRDRIVIRIIHGKGLNSANNQPVLKHIIRKFLIRQPRLLAYSSAHSSLGGDGATCCCLSAQR